MKQTAQQTVVFFDTKDWFDKKDWEENYVKERLLNTNVVFLREAISLDNVALAKDAQIIAVFIDSQVTKEILDLLPNLKAVVTRSTGFDHIDLKTCKERGIVVSNIPHYGDNTVAEHTFALLLDLSRKVHDSIAQVKNHGFSVKGATGFDLKNKTLGIVGTGRIGIHVARIAQGFQMNIIAFDVKEDKKLAKKLGFTYVSLQDLLKQSDIITLHAPYNEHTHHLINMGNIDTIKRGAYLINTSRGGIVETDALVKALDQGILAGAGLDVLEEENSIKEEEQFLSEDFSKGHNLKTILENHILMERDNVIITPHNAFNSKEALERILEATVENITSYMKGKPINIVG